MKFEQYLITERDVAKLPVEKCKDFKGMDKVKCKIEQYEEYLDKIKDAINTSTSDDEMKDLKASEKWAKGVLFKLRQRERAK